jgi:hypothetical protein
MLSSAEMAEAARPLIETVKQRVSNVVDGGEEEVALSRTSGGTTIILTVKDIGYFLAANNVLCARRWDANGDAELGSVQADGSLRWAHVILNPQTGN